MTTWAFCLSQPSLNLTDSLQRVDLAEPQGQRTGPRGLDHCIWRSRTWADMSISLERDSRLPSSVFRKSSRQPEEREVVAELPLGDPTLARPASQGVGCCPSGREVGGTLSGLLYPQNKPPTAAGASALQKLHLSPHSSQEALICCQLLGGHQVSVRVKVTQSRNCSFPA